MERSFEIHRGCIIHVPPFFHSISLKKKKNYIFFQTPVTKKGVLIYSSCNARLQRSSCYPSGFVPGRPPIFLRAINLITPWTTPCSVFKMPLNKMLLSLTQRMIFRLPREMKIFGLKQLGTGNNHLASHLIGSVIIIHKTFSYQINNSKLFNFTSPSPPF